MFSIIRKLLNFFDTHRKITRDKLRRLEKIIDHKINREDIFIESLTHRSAVDGKKLKNSNERLEFLGDSVVGFVIARELYDRFPCKDEGYLTKARANFVNRNSLFEAGNRIGLLDLIFMQPELLQNVKLSKKSIVSDAFEALIGAIYLDCGMEIATKFIQKYVVEPSIQLKMHLTDDNFKSRLLELAQSIKLEIPRYFVIKEEGPEHDRTFTVEVKIAGNTLGIGQGKNKKTAEQEAARQALLSFESVNNLTLGE